MNPAHGNPAIRYVWKYISSLMDQVGGALCDLRSSGVEPDLALAARHMDLAIRQLVSEGDWAEAGITDVRELFDLHVSIVPNERGWAIAVTMPYVMQKLNAQDDPDAN